MLSAEDRWLLDLEDDEWVGLLLDLEPVQADRLIARVDELTRAPGTPIPPPPPEDEGYEDWIAATLAGYFPAPLAEHHHEMWRWAWTLRAGRITDPLVAVFARGGAKSTSAEGITVAAGSHEWRRFVLYVCATQDQANDHVVTIQGMLESDGVTGRYPNLGTPLLGKLGQVRAWRQNRVRTASGFTVHALGLDAAVRGIKVDDARPDLIVLDDIDDQDDTPTIAAKKLETIQSAILPSGATDVTVLAVQNLIHPDSVFAQIVDGRAEMLHQAKIIGPIPALRGAAFEQDDDTGGWRIVAGEPTWVGQSVRVCQAQIDLFGISMFRREAQHEVTARPGGMYDHLTYRYVDERDLPDLDVVTVWCDPAVTDKDSSDSQAIQVDGRAGETIYRLWSFEQRTSPLEAIKLAIRAAVRFGATTVGIETDQGGDTWESVYRDALIELALDETDPLALDSFATRRAGISEFAGTAPTRLSAKAGSSAGGSKTERSARMLADYERSNLRLVHVLNDDATHEKLEAALARFPRTKPLDLADAAYWSWFYLRKGEGSTMQTAEGRIPTGRRAALSPSSQRIPTGAAAAMGRAARTLPFAGR